VRLQFCGVRGSTPSPGAEFAAVGGHTSCVAVTPEGADRPRLLLDAGTGIRAVTPLLDGEPFVGSILLSHLHWDHLQGLPFFSSGDRDDAVVHLRFPCRDDDPVGLLRRAMSPPHFPIGPEGLQGRWRFSALDEGELVVEGINVEAREVRHKGGFTMGYRLSDPSLSVAYLPDHLPSIGGASRDRALQLADGVDVLIHDAQFTEGEEAVAELYGHSTIEQACALAEEAGVGQLVLFHHAPARTDEQVEAIAKEAEQIASVPVRLAREGEALPSEP
jgi:ribonuclease BN (tRNA processing enzyme)